jgi:hypothetical protein
MIMAMPQCGQDGLAGFIIATLQIQARALIGSQSPAEAKNHSGDTAQPGSLSSVPGTET